MTASLARRSRRARRRAPAVPHRHRHDVARSAGRGAVTGLDFSPSRARRLPASWPPIAGSTRRLRRKRAVRRARRARGRSSTSCTPARAQSTGCPTSPAGRGSLPVCCDPVGCLHLHDAPPGAAGPSITNATTTCSSDRRVPVLRDGNPLEVRRARHLHRRRRTSMTNTRTCEWNHGLGEIVQAVIDAGLQLTMLRRAPLLRLARAAGSRRRVTTVKWRRGRRSPSGSR